MVYVFEKRILDETMITNVHIIKKNVEADVMRILARNPVTSEANIAAWLVKALTVIDLTTLGGDDTKTNVTRLCVKAANPLSADVQTALGFKKDDSLTTAAVCVYPSRVADAYAVLKGINLADKIPVAAVATGFPSGQYPLKTRLEEITYAIKNGAKEIDVVLDRSLVLGGKWNALFDEVQQMRKECGNAHLKVILAVGELGTLENVYKASMVSMMAGADFIKTSTGKETVNATLPVGLVMCRAIKQFYQKTGFKVGLKPAGGIKTPRDAINWLVLVLSELGPEWLSPRLFRIGASSLLGGIEKHLHDYTTGCVGDSARFNFI